MKRILPWLAFVLLAALAASWWLRRPAAKPALKPYVVIQDNSTIDFSSGRPVVNNSTGEKAIIDAAVKDMQEAARGITFQPLVAPPPQLPEPKLPAKPAPKP